MSLPDGTPLYHAEFPIRWGDMDALGHVNNIMYFRYFEQVRLEWYESMAFSALERSEEGILIVDNHAEYLKPLVYPAQVHVHMAGHSPGRSSFISTYTISSGDILFTRGASKIVWVNQERGQSIPLPERVRSLLEGVTHA